VVPRVNVRIECPISMVDKVRVIILFSRSHCMYVTQYVM
jgi:hypothetical protein